MVRTALTFMSRSVGISSVLSLKVCPLFRPEWVQRFATEAGTLRHPANMKRTRQSRPDFGLGSQAKVIETFYCFPSWLMTRPLEVACALNAFERRGIDRERC